jgi:hypothetical protein
MPARPSSRHMHGAGRRRPGGDAGQATPAALFALVLTFVLALALANLLTYQYGRGAVRNAVDQAARAGSRAGATPANCRQRGHEALDGLLSGPLGDDVALTCTDDGARARATATATFQGWVTFVPDWTFTVTATSAKESG